MAKDNSLVKQQREEALVLIKQITGLELKRCSTATAGLSVSNKDMRSNMFAHLLCNAGNFPTIAWMLENWEEFETGKFIPKEYADIADAVSVGYACGTSPRFVLAFNANSKAKVDRHQSKDAAKTGRPQEFIAWAQSWRMSITQSLWVGTSRSVKNGVADHFQEVKLPDGIAQITGSMDGYFMEWYAKDEALETECIPIKPTDEVLQAIANQRKFADLLAEGGLTVAKRLSGAKDFATAAQAAMEKVRAQKAAAAAKAAEAKPEAVKPDATVKVIKPPVVKGGKKAAKAA
jgi:hypothetical protein